MAESSPILDYVTPSSAPLRRLTLDESNGSVRVVFPVFPRWIYILAIVLPILVGCVKFVGGIVVARMMWQMANGSGMPAAVYIPLRRFAVQFLLEWSGMAPIWWALAAYQWWMYYRWGRVPRTLLANREGLTFSRLGWWRIREQKWPADQITGVEFRLIKGNLNWRRTVADLYIHLRKGRRLPFRLSSPDQELPAKIARRVARALTREGVPTNL